MQEREKERALRPTERGGEGERRADDEKSSEIWACARLEMSTDGRTLNAWLPLVQGF